jgi:hypothetical protein
MGFQTMTPLPDPEHGVRAQVQRLREAFQRHNLNTHHVDDIKAYYEESGSSR